MKTLKVKSYADVPQYYTGAVEWDGRKEWFKNGNSHREDGPARIYKDDYKSWYLDGKYVWDSVNKLDLTSQIILSKTQPTSNTTQPTSNTTQPTSNTTQPTSNTTQPTSNTIN